MVANGPAGPPHWAAGQGGPQWRPLGSPSWHHLGKPRGTRVPPVSLLTVHPSSEAQLLAQEASDAHQTGDRASFLIQEQGRETCHAGPSVLTV